MDRSAEAQARIDRGREVWKKKSSDGEWSDWCTIGAAYMEGRTEVLVSIGANRIGGRLYNTEFSRWCSVNGFDPPIDKSVLSHLLFVMEPEHLAIAGKLREEMTPAMRLKITHPTTMYKRVRDYVRERDEGERKVKLQSPKETDAKRLAQSEARKQELEEEVASLREQLATGGTNDIKDGKVDEICGVLEAIRNSNRGAAMREKYRKIGQYLLSLADACPTPRQTPPPEKKRKR